MRSPIYENITCPRRPWKEIQEQHPLWILKKGPATLYIPAYIIETRR